MGEFECSSKAEQNIGVGFFKKVSFILVILVSKTRDEADLNYYRGLLIENCKY